MKSRPWIVGNWKMNGLKAHLAEARAIDDAAAALPGIDVALAPSFTLICPMAAEARHIAVGGQDCHARVGGAFTGDVAPPQLVDAGADFVILGHSERRDAYGESDSLVNAKARAALAAGLGIIVCVGESQAERDAGRAEEVVAAQLCGSLPMDGDVPGSAMARLAVAYEPVWAVGSARVPCAQDLEAVIRRLRAELVQGLGAAGAHVRILYGGSVTGGNAGELLAVPEVGGALVGGASLRAESFIPIMQAAQGLVTA